MGNGGGSGFGGEGKCGHLGGVEEGGNCGQNVLYEERIKRKKEIVQH